jgi:hypothetical protein
MRIAGIAGLTLLIAMAPAWGADLYPGARPDPQAQAATPQIFAQNGLSNAPKSTAYSTTDAWDKVVDYYRRTATEYKPPKREGYDLDLPKSIKMEAPGKITRLNSGIHGQQAFFTLDGAKELYQSSRWLMVTTPKVTSIKVTGRINDPAGMQFTYDGIQNGVTVITVVESQ